MPGMFDMDQMSEEYGYPSQEELKKAKVDEEKRTAKEEKEQKKKKDTESRRKSKALARHKHTSIRSVTCLEVYFPAMFQDKEFTAWVSAQSGRDLATLNMFRHEKMTPGSEVLTVFDVDDELNMPSGLPTHCRMALREICERNNVRRVVLRLVNRPEARG